MTPWNTIARLARGSLALLALALLISIGLIQASAYYANQVRDQLAQFQLLEGERQESLLQRQNDELGLRDQFDSFAKLREQGLVGQADRAAWVEALVASRQRLGLPDTLAYALQPPKPLAPAVQADSGSANESEPNANGDAPSGPLYHDLEFSLSAIHEEELLAFLQAYKETVRGRFRVDSCVLFEPSPGGLSARCNLRFFTLPEGVAKPARS